MLLREDASCVLSGSEQCWYYTFDFMNKDAAVA